MIIDGAVRRKDRRIWYVVLGVFVMVFLFTFLTGRFKSDEEVGAANASKFDAGYIISDYQMSNYNSMSEAEIQAFLTKKNPCGNTNYGDYAFLSERYPNMKWHFENGHFVCLSEERFGEGVSVGEGETAAHIIYQAAQDYRINPQVLIVLLEKEQGLITDTFPNSVQYRSATGYGCPDTAACDTEYYGFRNQVRHAAALFRTVLDGGWTNYPLGNNYIQYNPNAACGGSVVNIRNLATSALYRYTPYQPNAGALAAGYGQAYCGAYGNRNFYLYFEEWFGGITGEKEWLDMEVPRKMAIQTRTLRVNPVIVRAYEDDWGEVGEENYFDSKTTIEWFGKEETCLRTAEDTKAQVDRCIIMARMEETTNELRWTKLDEPLAMKVTTRTLNLNPIIRETYDDEWAEIGDRYYFTAKTTVEWFGKEETCLRTAEDTKAQVDRCIIMARMEETTEPVFEVKNTGIKKFKIIKDTRKYDLRTGESVQEIPISVYAELSFSGRLIYHGKVYYQTTYDFEHGINNFILADDLEEKVLENFVDFITPRRLKTKRETSIVDLSTGETCGYVGASYVAKYVTKINVEGTDYFRTEHDTENNSGCVVRAADVEEVGVWEDVFEWGSFMLFDDPRRMIFNDSVHAIDMKTGVSCDEYYTVGEIEKFKTKVYVGGRGYFRTEKATENNSNCAVPCIYLGEL